MSDNKKNDGLITSEDRSLRLRSASLVRRGLEQIAKANSSEQEETQDDAPRISEAEIAQQLENFAEHLDEVEEQANRDEQWRGARANSPLYQETTYEQRKANGLSAYEAFLRKGKEGIREHLNQTQLRKQQGRDDSSTSARFDSSETSGKDEDLQYNLGKAHLKSGRELRAYDAFEEAVAQRDCELYRYALGLVSVLVGDAAGASDQIDVLRSIGPTPFSDDLLEFLNKYSSGNTEDEESHRLLTELVDVKIHQAEVMTAMAAEFDRVASDE